MGDEFVIAVATNASTGWTWEITSQPHPAMTSFVGRDYVPS